ncbi:MAG: hypothetical protein SGBAC_009206 [Bacillariaceae sp.]
MINSTELQVLGPEYIEECASVMAKAFSNSPVYQYMFQGTAEFRTSALEWLFAKNIRIVLDKCPQALRGMLNEGNQVVCCFMWVPQEHQNVSLGEMLWHGLLKMPIKFGLDSVKRMLQVLDEFEMPSKEYIAQVNKSDQNKMVMEGSIQLQRMVVRPDCQGQGLGSKALKAVIAQESAKGKVNLHLETQSLRNVTFYERLGFKVVWDRDFYEEDKEHKFHSWYMVRMECS